MVFTSHILFLAILSAGRTRRNDGKTLYGYAVSGSPALLAAVLPGPGVIFVRKRLFWAFLIEHFHRGIFLNQDRAIARY